jgi:hypothetical protein
MGNQNPHVSECEATIIHLVMRFFIEALFCVELRNNLGRSCMR